MTGEHFRHGYPMTVSKAKFNKDYKTFVKQENTTVTSAGPTNDGMKTAPPVALAIDDCTNTVLLYNVFDPKKELNPYASHKSELKGIEREIHLEAQKFGNVKSFDSLKTGCCVVAFENTSSELAKLAAKKFVNVIHGRWFDNRQIVADFLPDLTKPVQNLKGLNRAVKLKNVFAPKQVEEEGFLQQLAVDFEAQCQQYGPIEKLDITWTDDDSTVLIIFVSSLSAADCISGMNNMMFDRRQISVIADTSEQYIVGNDDDIKELRKLSLSGEKKKLEREKRIAYEEAMDEAKRNGKGEKEAEQEAEFQAFWKFIDKEEVPTTATGLEALAEYTGNN